MQRKRVIQVLIVACAGVVVTMGYRFLQVESAPEDRLLLYGNVDIRDVRLAFAVSERIQTVHVEEGDQVSRGQLLAELDSRRFRAAVAVQEAELETARQALLEFERGSRKEDIEQARGELAAITAEASEFRRAYDRQLGLLKSAATSEQAMEDARRAWQAAEGRRQAAQARLDRLLAGPRSEEIARARARVAAAVAALERARVDLADTQLYAPSDGIIQERILEPGDMASPQVPVFSLALSNPLWVRAYVAEPDLGKLQEGMAASVSSDSYPDRHYRAWIGFISPVAEFTPKNVETTDLRTRLVYRLRVYVCDSAGELRLGMPVTVEVPLQQAPDDQVSGCGPD